MTQGPPPGGENDRFRDAVDLPLLRDLIATDALGAVREACEATFRRDGSRQSKPSRRGTTYTFQQPVRPSEGLVQVERSIAALPRNRKGQRDAKRSGRAR